MTEPLKDKTILVVADDAEQSINHIEDERLLQFASEIIDLSLDENIHFDNCAKCWRRLIEAIEFVVLMRTEEKTQLIV
jgi:hypothetical protein